MTGFPEGRSVLKGRDVRRDVPGGLAGLVADWIRRSPDAPACRDAHGTYSYRELDRHAAAVARFVRAEGADDAPVIVCMERRRALLAALLGVVRTGQPYLPVTEDTPVARLRRYAQICGTRTAVTSAATESLALAAGLRSVRIEASVEESAGEAPELATVVSPDQPAYVMFTSGSTGDPKGVQIPSGALCNRLLWMRDEYGSPEGAADPRVKFAVAGGSGT